MGVQRAHVVHWRTDRWAARRIWADWWRDRKSHWLDRLEKAIGRRVPWRRDRFSGGTYWPAGEPKPRTCSYCGGVHPDDALTLIARGWEVETTTKGYKRYLHPPGYRAAVGRFREAIHVFKEPPPWEGPRSPVPPVKLYTYHFSEWQRNAFNAALEQHDRAEAQ